MGKHSFFICLFSFFSFLKERHKFVESLGFRSQFPPYWLHEGGLPRGGGAVLERILGLYLGCLGSRSNSLVSRLGASTDQLRHMLILLKMTFLLNVSSHPSCQGQVVMWPWILETLYLVLVPQQLT